MRSPAPSGSDRALTPGDQDEHIENGTSTCRPDLTTAPPALPDANMAIEGLRSPPPPSPITDNLSSPTKPNENSSSVNQEPSRSSGQITDVPILPTSPTSMPPGSTSAVDSNLPAGDQKEASGTVNNDLLLTNGGGIEVDVLGLSGWLRDSMDYFRSVSGEQSWRDLISCWLVF
jgi:type IV secretory pathway VirB10-like protein